MKLTKIDGIPEHLTHDLQKFIEGYDIYDSSSSPEAQVIFIDRDNGYFLKRGEKNSLKSEERLGNYFYEKGLAPEVISYFSEEFDFLLTRKAAGLDLTNKIYLAEPKRLAEKMGELLRELHSVDFSDCPEKNRLKSYFELLEKNYKNDKYDLDFGSFKTKDEAYVAANRGHGILKCDTLIHGDFCLPNILFDNWNFSSFIDLGGAGVGDRHIDIFWGAWTLKFNLKTDAFRDTFFSAYGKEKIDMDALAAVSAIEIFA